MKSIKSTYFLVGTGENYLNSALKYETIEEAEQVQKAYNSDKKHINKWKIYSVQMVLDELIKP